MRLKNKLALVIVILLIISSIGFNYETNMDNIQVSATIITVNDDGGANHTSIQAAINSAKTGDIIYVWAGVYYENLIVNRSITLIGNGTGNTSIIGNGTGSVLEVTVDNVNISGLSINGSGSAEFDANIKLEHIQNCHIIDVISSQDKNGILLNYSSNCILENVVSNSTKHSGIGLYYSDWNLIENNQCNKNDYAGIYLQYSGNNTIYNNTCNDNAGDGIYVNNSKNNIVFNNICLNNSYYGIEFFRSASNTATNNLCEKNGYFGILLSFANNNDVLNNTFNNNTRIGIYLYEAYFNYIKNNTCNWNDEIGIYLLASNNTEVLENKIKFNKRYGLYLDEVIDNTITDNVFENDGLYIWGDDIRHWVNHTLSGNTMNGDPLAYYKHQTGTTIPASVGQVILANCSWMTIENQKLNNCSVGILSGFSNNLTISNNTCNDNYYGIFLSKSNDNKILNNTCKNNRNYGIRLRLSNNLSLEKNIGFNNTYGIYIYICNDLIINKNILNSNDYDGLYSYSSNFATLVDNTCNSNDDDGLQFDRATDYTINNNYVNGNKNRGLYIFRGNSVIVNNNQINSNGNFGIYNYRIQFTKITKNSCSNNNNHGIYIYYSDYVQIENNNCSGNLGGIHLQLSDYNTIANNTCSYNMGDGIYISPGSWEDRVINNICNKNNQSGITIESDRYRFDENGGKIIVDKNTCNFNNISGIHILNSNNNTITRNNCSENMHHGLQFDGDMISPPWLASENVVTKNSLISNNKDGVYSYNGTFNTFDDNVINSNGRYGINFNHSMKNDIKNNEIMKNSNGIYLNLTDYVKIINNICTNNTNTNLFLLNSSSNTIKENDLSGGLKGIYLDLNSDSNTFFRNTISFNNEVGILLVANCNSNRIYHNNIIMNTKQAEEINSSPNFWNNNLEEGNYWSDYSGLDNGASGRKMGDWIGDTEIPHLGLDHYPFIVYDGWIYPGLTELIDPGEFSSNGTYTLNWLEARNADLYTLQESKSATFLTTSTIYSGSELSFNIQNNPDGKFYYRVRTGNDNGYSDWSNIVDITINHPPKKVQGMMVSMIPMGNALNISWNTNIDEVSEYHLYYRIGESLDWMLLSKLQHPDHIYFHTRLINGETYHYRVRANDSLGQFSEYSIIVSGIPKDTLKPSVPTGFKIKESTQNSLTLKWDPNPESDVVGYNLYRDTSRYTSNWSEPINGKKVIIGMEFTDEQLEDDTTYFYVITAVDEVPNESVYSSILSGTTLLGPVSPEINISLDYVYMEEDTIDSTSIALNQIFKDRNGDKLTFRCEGKIYLQVTIDPITGAVTLIPEQNWYGTEKLYFFASDEVFSTYHEIMVTVTPVNDPPNDPTIFSPKDGLKVNDSTKIYFEAECSDPDTYDNNKLLYTWNSNISGRLGSGRKLERIITTPGIHLITLVVTDPSGETSIASIILTITQSQKPTEPEEPGGPDDDDSDDTVYEGVWFRAGVVIGILVVILIIILSMIYLRQRPAKKDVEDDIPFVKEEDEEEIEIELEEDEDLEGAGEYEDEEINFEDVEDTEIDELEKNTGEEAAANDELETEMENIEQKGDSDFGLVGEIETANINVNDESEVEVGIDNSDESEIPVNNKGQAKENTKKMIKTKRVKKKIKKN